MTPEPGDEVLRLFIAIEINDAVRRSLAGLQERLQSAGARVAWVRPENIHLTLAFLGDTFRARMADLAGLLDRLGGLFPPFRFEVVGAGSFGPPHSPRVLWAGVREEAGILAAVNQALREGLAALGWSPESRAFHPHLTLGRVRSARGAGALTPLLASAINTAHGSVDATRLRLMRSELHPRGARYDVLHASPLTGANTHGGQGNERRGHPGEETAV